MTLAKSDKYDECNSSHDSIYERVLKTTPVTLSDYRCQYNIIILFIKN